MKDKIHPEYKEARVICSCGETFTTRSTKSEIKVEICSKCHPFYTGKQKFIDAGGRVERFQKKFAKAIKTENIEKVENVENIGKPNKPQREAKQESPEETKQATEQTTDEIES